MRILRLGDGVTPSRLSTSFAALWNRFYGIPVTVACFDAPLPDLPSNFDALRLGEQAAFTWSAGVQELCHKLDDDIILLILEDYFLSAPVDGAAVDALVNLMERRPDIDKIDLSDDRLKVAHTGYGRWRGVDLVRSANDAPFQASVQAALWRREFLAALPDAYENAWQFEKNGTKRLIAVRQQGYRGVLLGTRNPPMQYVNAIGGEGSMPGTYALHRFPAWMRQDLGL